MDTKEQIKTQCEHTKEQLLKKIDRILDNAEDNGRALSDEEAHALKDSWKAIYYACQCCCSN